MENGLSCCSLFAVLDHPIIKTLFSSAVYGVFTDDGSNMSPDTSRATGVTEFAV